MTVAGFVLGVLGTGGTISYALGMYRIRRTRRFGADQLGLRPTTNVQVVPAVIPYHGSREDRVDALAIGEVLAVRALTEYFARYRPGGYQLLLNARDLDGSGLLILLGGPKWNPWTRDLLDAIGGAVLVSEADHEIVIEGTSRRPSSQNRDIALVVTGKNPLAANSYFLLCCGLQTFGTGAVARYLFEDVLLARSFTDEPGAKYRGFTAEVLLAAGGYGAVMPATVERFIVGTASN